MTISDLSFLSIKVKREVTYHVKIFFKETETRTLERLRLNVLK